MLNGVFTKLRFNFAITVATVGVIAGIVGTLFGAGVTIMLANNSEATCEFSFTSTDYEDYVTIDPKSGYIKYNLIQDTCSYSGDVKYKVGYKATFQTSYTYERETLKGNGDSTGYTKMVDQWGVRDYKIKLYQITTVSKTTGKLKLKVT